MVSRRKILSRSRDNLADAQYEQEEEEDVWYNMDKLFKVRKSVLISYIFITPLNFPNGHQNISPKTQTNDFQIQFVQNLVLIPEKSAKTCPRECILTIVVGNFLFLAPRKRLRNLFARVLLGFPRFARPICANITTMTAADVSNPNYTYTPFSHLSPLLLFFLATALLR